MALITVPTAFDVQNSDNCTNSDEHTFITANPDDQISAEGVSLKNALFSTDTSLPTPTIDDILDDDYVSPKDYHWYFLRVNYNRAEKFYDMNKDKKKGFLLWMPCQKKVKYENGKKLESLSAIFKSNIFIFSTEEQARSLTHHSPMTGYDYVDFAYDHTNQNEFGRDHKIIIPFNEMKNFIRAEKVHHPWAHVVPEEKIHFRPGGYVRVVNGAFEGVIGRIARVYHQTRVVISIRGILKYATAYVSPKNVIPIDEEVARDEADKALLSPYKRFEESRIKRAQEIKKHQKRNRIKNNH